MREIEFEVKSESPTLTTYGSLWKEPVEPEDKPVIELIVVQVGKRAKLKEKLERYGNYKYRFVFGQFQHAEDFTLTAFIRGTKESLPPGPSKHTTKHQNINVFKFEVF